MARAICPYCEREIQIEVKRAVKTAKSTPGGILGRFLGANRYEFPVRQEFNQTAAPAIFSRGQPVEQEPEPRGLSSDVLEPGETRIAKTLRALTMADVTVPGLFAIGSGVILGLGSIAPAVANQWRWYVPVCTGFVTTGVCWFASTWRIWWPSGLIAHIEELTRLDLNGDGRIGDLPEPTIEMVRQEKRDGRVHERHTRMPTVKAGNEALARWFWRVVREDGRSFSIRGAQNYHITDVEVAAVQGYFIREKQADKGANNWVIPNEAGLDAMWSFVKRYYPDARLPQGTDDDVQNTGLGADTQTGTQD